MGYNTPIFFRRLHCISVLKHVLLNTLFLYFSPMKEKVAITLDDGLLSSLDGLVANGVGKNRSQIIEAFLREHMSEKNRIHAIIIAHDIKWD